MKIRPYSDVETEWSPTGNGAEATKVVNITGTSGQTVYTVPARIRFDTELTRKGMRRAVLRIGATLPGSVMAMAQNPAGAAVVVDPNKDPMPVSTHIVFEVPQGAYASMPGTDQGVPKILSDFVASLIAIITGATPTWGSGEDFIDHAMRGDVALDVINGNYGTPAGD